MCLEENNRPHYAFFKSAEVRDHLASLGYYFYLRDVLSFEIQ